MAKGRFITLEGLDGSGKTCNMGLIQKLLVPHYTLICTREPGGTKLGEGIRGLLLQHQNAAMEPLTELLLLAAARHEHISKLIVPALNDGHWVLCDRFFDATYAYQGSGRGLHPDTIRIVEALIQKDLQPDLTILLDLPMEIRLSRIKHRGNTLDRFESQSYEFFERVRQGYLERAKADPQRVKVVGANRPLDLVQQDISSIIGKFCEYDKAKTYD
ncbi:hypothetical protein TI04_02885 [Achromatium sp. WMS2]|nr:hypothetical protein TI04_02885 [Achromatium sp. WMS2]